MNIPLSPLVRWHSLGSTAVQRSEPVAIIKYGDYECAECKRLSDVLRRVLEDDGPTVNYVFRHLPLGASDYRRAVAAEVAAQHGKFWEMHEALFRHAGDRESDVIQAAEEAGIDLKRFGQDSASERIRELVAREIEQAKTLGISRLPTLLIGGKEYDGAWDTASLREAIRPPVAKRVKDLAVEFAAWAAARGAILLVFALLALLWRNSLFGDAYQYLWNIELGLVSASRSLTMPLHHWVNDLLMAVFFLVVGLELKRELFCGELSDLRRAAFPAAAALGGMVVPAAFYLMCNWGTDQAGGWGVPMATDIAFALGVLALLGSRVPTSMRVFATALAIVDDIGAIFVLAFAYNQGIHWAALAATVVLMLVLIGLNRARVYALWPYITVGLLLWLAVYSSGLHATLAGVLLAATIPTREKAALDPLLAQFAVDVQQARRRVRDDEGYESEELQRLADRVQIIDRRLHPPAERLEHKLQPWSAYFVLPIFALANAGIAASLQSISLMDHLSLGIILGLVVGKPVGIMAASWLAHRWRLGQKPSDATWSQVFGVGCLCGIGFTMSMFISNEAFSRVDDLESAKFAVMLSSILAAVAGTVWLAWPRNSLSLSFRPRVTQFTKEISNVYKTGGVKIAESCPKTDRRQQHADPVVAQADPTGSQRHCTTKQQNAGVDCETSDHIRRTG